MTSTPGGATSATSATTGSAGAQANGERPSIGELFGEVSRDLSELIRQEVELAKAEAQQSAKRAGKGAGLLTGALSATHYALLFLSITVWWGIGNSTGRAWSALIVFAIWAIIAAVLGLLGKKSISSVRGLDRTTETVSKIPPALKGHEEQNR